MARRTDYVDENRKLLSMTQEEKRKQQRKRLMEEGLQKRKRQIRKEKFYGKQ